MSGLAGYVPRRNELYGRCKRCKVEMDGMRGIVSISLFRKASGKKGQESLSHRAMTMCEPCTIEVWEQVYAALQPKESSA